MPDVGEGRWLYKKRRDERRRVGEDGERLTGDPNTELSAHANGQVTQGGRQLIWFLTVYYADIFNKPFVGFGSPNELHDTSYSVIPTRDFQV